MVSSFVVFTDTTVGLRRAAPHQAAALDPPGSRLISRAAAGFRHRRPAVAGDMRLARGSFASAPQHPRRAPAGIPATGRKVRTPGCTFNGSPTGSSPSTASLTPRPPAAARRLSGRACGSSRRGVVASRWPLLVRSVRWPSLRHEGYPPAEVGRQVRVFMFTGGPVLARRGSRQPVAEQPGRWPVHSGGGAPAMRVPPGRAYAGKADFCGSSEGSVEATRRHAWGCWA